MKEFIEIGTRLVEIRRRSRQRYLRLSIKPGGSLRVSCARRVSYREIERFVADSEDFIFKTLKRLAEHEARFPKKRFESGEPFLFFGQRLTLSTVWSWEEKIRVERIGQDLEIVAPVTSSREERREAVFKFFRKAGKLHLKQRLEFFARIMNKRPRTVKIRGQTTRWGSCSALSEISLNWKLISAPQEVIDYVVVHELAHMEHMNHSTSFWSVVEKHFPNYRGAKKWLRENTPEISAQFD